MARIGIAVVAVACGASPAEPSAPIPAVVSLSTRDGVQLEADRYDAAPGAPAVVLLHMTPTCCDRTDWPPSFIGRLQDEGWAVLVPDRRGAGASEGGAEDAFLGEAGRYDVEAAALSMVDDYGALAIVGASNGTTSMVDYAAWAPDEGLPVPVGLGFMTGGAYTENQTAMGPWLAATPAFFTYSTAERDWSVAQQGHDAGGWSFREYPDGDHGTRLLAAAPQAQIDVVAELRSILAR